MKGDTQAGADVAALDQAAGEWAERATAWRRWAPSWAAFTNTATDLIVAAAHVTPGMHVLDVASGAGEPALTLAATVGPRGRVTATDVAPAMLAIAYDLARQSSVSNMTCMVAGADCLPFAAARFDTVTCRFGIAHVPDYARALREIRRVLRPGGRAAFVVWGPRAKNPFFTIIDDALALYPLPAPPSPAAPGPFTFAASGTLSRALGMSGFRHIHEETHRIALRWPGPVEEAWQGRSEMSAAASRRRAELAPEEWTRVGEAALQALRAYDDGAAITLPGVVIVASGGC